MSDTQVLRVALDLSSPVMVHGFAGMVASVDPNIQVVGVPKRRTSLIGVDVTVMDLAMGTQADRDAVADAVADPLAGAVALLVWDISAEMIHEAIALGCRGIIDSGSLGSEVAAAVRSIASGELFISSTFGTPDQFSSPWRGHRQGLSQRESEVISWLVRGYTNTEIGEAVFLSHNTVKYHLRKMYAKIGVARRPDAVRWGMEHGFHH